MISQQPNLLINSFQVVCISELLYVHPVLTCTNPLCEESLLIQNHIFQPPTSANQKKNPNAKSTQPAAENAHTTSWPRKQKRKQHRIADSIVKRAISCEISQRLTLVTAAPLRSNSSGPGARAHTRYTRVERIVNTGARACASGKDSARARQSRKLCSSRETPASYICLLAGCFFLAGSSRNLALVSGDADSRCIYIGSLARPLIREVCFTSGGSSLMN